MKRKIKLIWDFRGPDSLKIAEHHSVHLKEFTITKNLTYDEIATTEVSEFYSVAYIVIDEKDMVTYRDALKPHRGEIAN